MTDFARLERLALADLSLRLGPDAPTLCAGWTTRDLAAHIVVRDRRPDLMAELLLPPLRGHGERLRTAKAAQPYESVLAEVRTPPPWSLISNRLTDELFNTVEFFIHHEDVRRGGPDWEPRTLDPEHERAIWRTTRLTARIGLRRLGLPARVHADGLEPFEVGENPQVSLSGPAGELALFLSGRQRAARVALDGPSDVVERLRRARLGI